MIFPYFSQKIDFDISCKLPPKKTICMKIYQSLFSWEMVAENFTQHAKHYVC